MKEMRLILLTTGLMVTAVSFIFTGCTKEGPAGKDGKDANATCTQCHNFGDTIVTKIFQYDASKHASGSTTTEGSRTACAPCHTHQGFVEVLASGLDTTAAPFDDAAPINCRTCHNIHTTYTNGDWALRTTAPFHPRYDPTVTIDLAAAGGSANLCGRCHQARLTSPWITNPTSTTDSLKPTSSRWGPHNGPQSLILAGKGAFEVGAVPFDNSPHRDQVACITCHGATAQGNLVGGHTLWVANKEAGIDKVAGCTKAESCHPNATDFDIDGKQTEIEGKFNDLKTLLAAAGMLNVDSTSSNFMLLRTGKKYAQKDLAIFWNFKMIYADRSMGVHNYKYTRDMLQSGIDYFNTK
jgi:hypothetical protein